MKIVQLIYGLGSGGAEKFVVDLSNELSSRGHDVTILMLRSKSDSKFGFNCSKVSCAVKLISLGIPEGFQIRQIRLVEDAILEEKPDVVHAHLDILPFMFRLCLIRRNIRFIHTIHNLAQYETPSFPLKAVNRFLYRNSLVKPVTISGLCDDSFRKYYDLDCSIRIDNGCARPQKSPEYESVRSFVAQLPKPVFVHIARYSSEKNQKMLVDAFNALSKDFSLLVIGPGFEDADDLRRSAGPNIHFLGRKSNIGDYLYCADAFCLSSLYEGLPISLIEAMACGLPAVCTPAGGIPDVIQNGKTGYISEGFGVAQYLSVIKACIDNPLDGIDIMNEYRNKFSIESCASNYLNIY